MKKHLIFLAILVFVFPTVLLAQDAGLSPATGGIVPCDGATDTICNFCHVVELGQNILTWLIAIIAAIIALVFVLGGLKMVINSTNESERTKAKDMMTNAIIGFIILLASWLIVDTILKVFIMEDPTAAGPAIINQEYGPWNQIKCEAQPTAGAPSPDEEEGELEPGELSDAQARQLLADAGISVNAQEPQTSLEGMKASTIQAIINLKNACGCDVTVTGGTETNAGHSDAHLDGLKYDMRTSPDVTKYILSNFTELSKRSDGAPQYQDPKTKIIYALEGDHWDVTVGG